MCVFCDLEVLLGCSLFGKPFSPMFWNCDSDLEPFGPKNTALLGCLVIIMYVEFTEPSFGRFFLLIMWKDRVDGYSFCFISFYCATHMWIVRHCCHNVSGCLSHASIVSKWIKISSDFFLCLVALPLLFSNTIWWLQNSNGKGSLSLGWIR